MSNMIEKMIEAKEKMIPKEGFRVVGVDPFEQPGEELFTVSDHATKEEAESALKTFLDDNPEYKAHIYTPDTK